MKHKKAILDGLITSPFFNKETLRTEVKRVGLSEHSVDAYVKDSSIVRLKNDFYIHRERLNRERSNLSFIFYLANALRAPSYISLESALQYYGLMTETIAHTVTSVTSNVTRSYTTKAGKFLYRSIKEELFDFYETSTKGRYRFFIATNFKCIFDYLYFLTDGFRKKINHAIFDVVRIDVGELPKGDKVRFNKLMRRYADAEIKI